MFYMKKNKEKEAVKAKEREEKEKLKDVLITGTAESEIRKAQFERVSSDDDVGVLFVAMRLRTVEMAVGRLGPIIVLDENESRHYRI